MKQLLKLLYVTIKQLLNAQGSLPQVAVVPIRKGQARRAKQNIILLILIFSVNVYAQDERAKVANAYEQTGDYRNAARLWQELLKQNPNDENAFNGVVRTLKALDNYPGLVDVVKEKVQRTRNAKTLALYGQVLYKAKQPEEADKAWNEALQAKPLRKENYREVVLAQIEIRLSDKAIATMLQERKAFTNEIDFADELAQLYSAKGDIDNGVKEILKAFSITNNIQQAEGRLTAMMNSDSTSSLVGGHMDAMAKQNDDSPPMMQLYQWFLRQSKQYAKAFECTKRLDKIVNGGGREIVNFAEQSRTDGQLDVAIQAFSYILDMDKKNQYRQYAYYGYARALEAKVRSSSAMTEKEVNDIITLYRDIINDNPKGNFAPEAQYHIANLYNTQTANTKAAMEEYQNLIKTYQYHPITALGVIELGNMYLQLNDIASASRYYSIAVNQYSGINPQSLDRALFAMADVHFYQHQFDSALVLYQRIAQNTESEFANDAIEKSTMITLTKDDTVNLTTFASAELKQYQKKYDEAIGLYSTVASSKQSPDLAERSYLEMADIMFKQKNYSKSREYYAKLIELNPETIYGDGILLSIANSFVLENDKQTAIKILNELLAKFPRSIYLQEAREKIRKLRGDA